MWRDAARGALAVALSIGCGPSGPGPELRAEVATLREIIQDDPAAAPIAEVERVAVERPVHAAQMLERDAIPAARRQVALVREASVTTEPGRGYARRVAEAYAERLRGLEQWHGYLEDAATDDAALLESITTRRHASVALVTVERDMDAVTPIARPRPR